MKTVDNYELIKLLKEFISNIKKETVGLKTSEYKVVYKNTKTNAHFYAMYGGNSKFVNIPYVSFLAHEQKTTKGIYPIIGYNRKQETNNFFVGYGISEKNQANASWHINLEEKFQSNENKSIFYKTLLTISTEDDIEKYRDIIIASLDEIIEQFHQVFQGSALISTDKKIQKVNNSSLNQILYGPPGTGKTYNTIIEAMKIIDKDIIKYDNNGNCKNYSDVKDKFDKLKDEGQIQFVTFHQSYSYEEFVEGIKPILKDGQVIYEVQDGVFKKICKQAMPIKSLHKNDNEKIDFTKTKIFKMSLGNTQEKEEDIYEYCIKNNVVSLGWKNIDFSSCKTSKDFKDKDESWGSTALERFISWMDIGSIVIITNGNQYFRAIGKIIGDYYHDENTPISHTHFRKVKWLYQGDDIHYSKIKVKQFSQQSIYEFYKSDIKIDELNNIIVGNDVEEEDKPYILIIDEINRGNISKIFGELITLIEEDKRLGNKHELTVQLPYSSQEDNSKPFGVPKNLYIIGTMNTYDRSIASIDIALRRRFKFKEMMPNCDIITEKVGDINLKEIFNNLNTKIKILLDRDHQIGHSYFVNVSDEGQLKQIWFDSIIPLLNEYFYGDWEKLKLVIPGFIKTEDIPKELQSECDEKEYYEFKTLKDIESDDFKALLEQKVFKENNAE